MAKNATVYCGNLPYSTTEQQLRDLFFQRKIVRVNIPVDRDTGRAKGFGFVEFETPGEAEEVVSSMNGTEFGGRTLKVSIAHDKSKSGGATRDHGGNRRYRDDDYEWRK